MFQKFFAAIYDTGMYFKETYVLGKKRETLLSTCQGYILEIGCGTGVNFQYYPDNSIITALDPSSHMTMKAQKKREKKNITLLTSTLEQAKQKNQLRNTYDHIVFTLVLCSIPNYEETIDHALSLLAPDGSLIVMEHILSKHIIIQWLQNFFTPIQKCFADGCHLNRPTDILIKNKHMVCIHEEYFGLIDTFWIGVYTKQ